MNKKADSSTPIWIQAFGFLLVVMAIFAITSWGLNAFGASDNLEKMIQEANLDYVTQQIYDFNKSSDPSVQLEINLIRNSALIYYAPRSSFNFILNDENLPKQYKSLPVSYSHAGSSFPKPEECTFNKPCICICTNAKDDDQNKCDINVCKDLDVEFKSEYKLNEVFGEEYLFANSSWSGGFLIASNHDLIRLETVVHSQYNARVNKRVFAGIYLEDSQKSSDIKLTLLKAEDDKLSIKWGDQN